MKGSNIKIPTESDILKHYPELKDAPIEIIPHTKIWATKDGVLLWDPKNGYADITVPTRLSSAESNTLKPTLKRVVYLTGPQGSGKSRLVSMMRNAVELNRGQFIGFTDLSRAIQKYDKCETVVICTNDMRPQAFNIENALRIWCRERKLEFHNINLKLL
jgi:hypothetical protein